MLEWREIDAWPDLYIDGALIGYVHRRRDNSWTFVSIRLGIIDIHYSTKEEAMKDLEAAYV